MARQCFKNVGKKGVAKGKEKLTSYSIKCGFLQYMRTFYLTEGSSVNPVACAAHQDFSYREKVLTSVYFRQSYDMFVNA